MATLTLAELGQLAKVLVDKSSVPPGELVTAHVALPLPGENNLLGSSAYAIDVVWRVTKTAPTTDTAGTITGTPPPGAILGTEYIAPGGLHQLAAAFGLMPAIGGDPAVTTSYWAIAELTITWTGDAGILAGSPTGAVQQLVVEKASGRIDALGLSDGEIVTRAAGLFKIEMPTVPVEPGAALTARIRPKGGEDSEWDLESATSVLPKYDLAAKIKLDPLFKPIGRIVNGIFGVANQISGAAVRLLLPVVKVMAAIEGGIQSVAGGISRLLGRKNPLRGVNPVKEVERLLRSIRIRNIDLFKNLELPIDASLLNRDFTTTLVPRDAAPPLPGPSGLLPTIPSLEQQLELTDQLPAPLSALPIVGSLQVPLSLTTAVWELWRPDITLRSQAISNTQTTIPLVVGDARKLRYQRPFWMVIFASTVDPETGSNLEIVRVDRVGIPDADSLQVTRQQWGTTAASYSAGTTYRMRLLPVARLIPGPAGEQKAILDPLSASEAAVAAQTAATAANIPYTGPALPSATPFWLIWWNGASADPYADPNVEIIKVTGHNPAARLLTNVERGQYGTTASSHPAGRVRIAPIEPAVTVRQGYDNAAPVIQLVAGDARRLPQAPFFAFWWNATDFARPNADRFAEVVQVTSIDTATETLQIVRGLYGRPAVAHDTGGKTYRLHVAADYFEIGNTAASMLKKTFAIEPPVQPEADLNLQVSLKTIINNAPGAPTVLRLPPVPVRLVGFNPLSFIAQQLELVGPPSAVEPGDEISIQLGSALPLDPVDPRTINVSVSIGALPTRTLPLSITWEVLGENNEPLTEGTDYALGGTANAISLLIAPSLQIMRRQNPATATRYVRARLQTQLPRLEQALPPFPIPIVALQVPAFVALFRRSYFQTVAADAVQVLLPSYYVSQAPDWVEDWDTFRTRLNELVDRLTRLLALAGGTATTPPAAGSTRILSDAMIRRLTLTRGALDYVANRAPVGKLGYLRAGGSNYFAAKTIDFIFSSFVAFPGVASDPFRNARTIIVVNDAQASVAYQSGFSGPLVDLIIPCDANNPICIVWSEVDWSTFGQTQTWIPRGSAWPTESLTLTRVPWLDLAIVRLTLDQLLPINNFFPAPAANWAAPLE
jgi:hypothetical protein